MGTPRTLHGAMKRGWFPVEVPMERKIEKNVSWDYLANRKKCFSYWTLYLGRSKFQRKVLKRFES